MADPITLRDDGAQVIGKLIVTNLAVEGISLTGDVTFGDSILDTAILKGGLFSGSATGAALTLDATYTKSKLIYSKGSITSWTGIGGNYRQAYLRAESTVDSASAELYGMELYATANGCGLGSVQGLLSIAYAKGDTTDTIVTAWGVHGEFGMDAGRSNTLTLTTAAAPLFGKVLSGKVADYTKIHGAYIQFGDMDGGSRTFGDGLKLIDSPDESGTSVLTNGINVNIGTTTGVLVNASATDAFKAATGTFTNGLNIGGTVTTAVTAGACTTLIASTGAIATAVHTFAADSTAVVTTSASASIPANTGYLLIKSGATTFRIPVYANS